MYLVSSASPWRPQRAAGLGDMRGLASSWLAAARRVRQAPGCARTEGEMHHIW